MAQANLQRSMCGPHNSSGLEAGSSKVDGPTIQDLLDAGEDVASTLCQLTNEIHPIFQAENICVCQYEDIRCCVQPHFADLASRDSETPKAHPIASPYPEDNLIVRATMQLASRILTHDDALPFWAGILDCIDPDTGEVSSDFEVHPSKHLSTQRNVEVLGHLSRFADRVRFHYKADEVSRALDLRIDLDDPDRYGNPSNSYYAFREGKPVIESGRPPFANIVLDTTDMDGYDQTTEDWEQYTVTALKREIVNGARLLCHEIAHALVTYSFVFENDPAFNDEKMIETGYSMENFLFGGVLRRDDDALRLMSWPNEKIWDEYYAGGTTIPLLGPLSEMPAPWEYDVHPDAYECFLTDEFWDEREVREGRFKKMWLRPEQ